jgi:uncharacterized protein (DUF1778 family)
VSYIPANNTGTQNARRTARLEARLTADQKARLTRAAELAGRNLTDFVVSAAEARAREVIRDHDTMTLSRADAEAFVAALLADAEPGDRLKAAAARHRQRTRA